MSKIKLERSTSRNEPSVVVVYVNALNSTRLLALTQDEYLAMKKYFAKKRDLNSVFTQNVTLN